jgi:CrcB protein
MAPATGPSSRPRTVRARVVTDRHAFAAIFAGGLVGAIVRAEIAVALPHDSGRWPWATVLVNVAGAFVLGYVITRVEDGREPFTHAGRLIGTGFCGALTTFSTMQLELLQMLDDGHVGLAITYALVSLAAGLAAVALATRIARHGHPPAPAPR